MILLSFSSSVKYILSLMLAVLGYLPMENIPVENNSDTKRPLDLEWKIQADTLLSPDTLFIFKSEARIHGASNYQISPLIRNSSTTILSK